VPPGAPQQRANAAPAPRPVAPAATRALPVLLPEAAAEAYRPKRGYPRCRDQCDAGCETCFGYLSRPALKRLGFIFAAWDAVVAALSRTPFRRGDRVLVHREGQTPTAMVVVSYDGATKKVELLRHARVDGVPKRKTLTCDRNCVHRPKPQLKGAWMRQCLTLGTSRRVLTCEAEVTFRRRLYRERCRKEAKQESAERAKRAAAEAVAALGATPAVPPPDAAVAAASPGADDGDVRHV